MDSCKTHAYFKAFFKYFNKREKKLTYFMLEEKCNMYQQYLTRIVSGGVNVSMFTMVKLAQGLETPLAQL